MTFEIVDAINNEICTRIESNNGKNALKRFRRVLMTAEFYEIHKFKNRWIMSNMYGSYFVAQPEK